MTHTTSPFSPRYPRSPCHTHDTTV